MNFCRVKTEGFDGGRESVGASYVILTQQMYIDFPEKFDKKETELILKKMLRRLIEDKYGGDSSLEKYLEYEMKDFAFELKSDICHIDWQ